MQKIDFVAQFGLVVRYYYVKLMNLDNLGAK